MLGAYRTDISCFFRGGNGDGRLPEASARRGPQAPRKSVFSTAPHGLGQSMSIVLVVVN